MNLAPWIALPFTSWNSLVCRVVFLNQTWNEALAGSSHVFHVTQLLDRKLFTPFQASFWMKDFPRSRNIQIRYCFFSIYAWWKRFETQTSTLTYRLRQIRYCWHLLSLLCSLSGRYLPLFTRFLSGNSLKTFTSQEQIRHIYLPSAAFPYGSFRML